MSWASNSVPVTDVMNKGQILVNLFKLGTLSKDSNIDCENEDLSPVDREKNCVKVSAKDVIDHYVEAINFMNIDERDADILNLLGKEYKYQQSQYEGLIKKKDEHVLYSYYDMIFKRIFSDMSESAAEDAWFKEQLVNFVESVHKINGSTFIFPTPESINQAYVKRYSSWLKQYYSLNYEFLEEVKNQLETIEGFTYRYRLGKVRGVGRDTNKFSDNKSVSLEPLVSDLIYGKFEGVSQQLNNDTSGYFSSSIHSDMKKISELVKPAEEVQ